MMHYLSIKRIVVFLWVMVCFLCLSGVSYSYQSANNTLAPQSMFPSTASGPEIVWENAVQDQQIHVLLGKLSEHGDSIGFDDSINDFSIRRGKMIYFNAKLLKSHLGTDLLRLIIVSQLKRHLFTKPIYKNRVEELVCEISGFVTQIHALVQLDILAVGSADDLSFLGVRYSPKEIRMARESPAFLAHIIRTPTHGGYEDPRHHFDLKQSFSRHRVRSIHDFLIANNLDRTVMVETLRCAQSLIDLKVPLKDKFFPGYGYGDKGPTSTGMSCCISFYLEMNGQDPGNKENLISFVGYWLNDHSGNGCTIDDEGEVFPEWNQWLEYYHVGRAYTAAQQDLYRYLISNIKKGRDSQSYERTLQFLLRHAYSTDSKQQHFVENTVKLLGFLLETDNDKSAIEMFLLDFFKGFEKAITATAYVFCEQLVEEAHKENAEVFFLYRGSWALQEMAKKIAAAKGYSMGDTFHALYMTKGISQNNSFSHQLKYLVDQGIFKNRKVYLVDTGFHGTMVKHCLKLIRDDEGLAIYNKEYGAQILPKPTDDVAIRLLVYDSVHNEPSWVGLNTIKAFSAGRPSMKFSYDENYKEMINHSSVSAFFLDTWLEYKFLSPIHLIEKDGTMTPQFEETYLPRLQNLSEQWLKHFMDKPPETIQALAQKLVESSL